MDEHRRKQELMEALVRMRTLSRNRAMREHERERALMKQAQSELDLRRQGIAQALEQQHASLRTGALIDPHLQGHRLLAMDMARRSLVKAKGQADSAKAACAAVQGRLVRTEVELEIANRARSAATAALQYRLQQADTTEVIDVQLRRGVQANG